MATPSRPVFGQKPQAKKEPKNRSEKYRVVERQESFDFCEQLPQLAKGFTQIPDILLDKFALAYADQPGALVFMIQFERMTHGGRFDLPMYGEAGKKLKADYEARKKEYEAARKAGKAAGEYPQIPRPRWVAMTNKKAAEMTRQTEDGGQKLLKSLEEDEMLLSARFEGKRWFAINYMAMKKLEPKEVAKHTSKAATTNIPDDIGEEPEADPPDPEPRPKPAFNVPLVILPGETRPRSLAAECPAGEKCCLAAKFSESPQATENNSSLDGKSGLEDGFTATCSEPMQISGKHKSGLEDGFDPFTLILTPGGGGSNPVPLRAAIDAIRIRSEHPQALHATASLSSDQQLGRVLDLKLGEPPAADDATTRKWRKPMNALTRQHWKTLAGDAEIAQIAGLCEAIGAGVDDFIGWANDKCSRQDGRIPKNYPVGVIVKLAHDDFQSYWLTAGDAVPSKPDPVEEFIRTGKRIWDTEGS